MIARHLRPTRPLRGAALLALAAVTTAPPTAAQDDAAARRTARAVLDARHTAAADQTTALAHLFDVLDALPADSVLTVPLVETLAGARESVPDLASFAERLRAQLERPLHGVARDSADAALSAVLRDLGRYDAARALTPHADQVTELTAIGPFGDEGDFFLDTVFPPELDFPPVARALDGRYGPVRRYVVHAEPGSPFVDLADPAWPERDGCFYALHRFELPAAASGYVEIVSSSSFALWLDGVEIARVDRLAERRSRRLFVPATFREGENRLLVKTALARRSSIALRYVDAAGRPLPDVSSLDPEAALPDLEPAAAEAPPAPGPFVTAVDLLARYADAAAEPAGALAACTALLAVESGAQDRAMALLHAAEDHLDGELPPAVLLGWARVYSRAEDLPAELRGARSRALVDRVVAAHPEHVAAVLWQAELLVDEDRVEDALRAVTDLPAHSPRTLDILRQLHARLGDTAGARAARRRCLDRFAWSVDTWQDLARRRLRDDDLPGAERALQQALRHAPGRPGLLALQQQLASRTGDAEAALTAFARRAFPGEPARRARDLHQRADIHRTLGDADAARADLRATTTAPDVSAALLAEAGRDLIRLDARADGLAALRRALERNPADVALRRELARLDGAAEFPLLDDHRMSAAEVDAVARAFEPGEAERGASSTLVLDRMVARLLPDGSWIAEVHQLRRINDRGGVQDHEQQHAAARADEVLRLRTIGADDFRSYVPQRVGGGFSMPRVEPGAFIEVLYRDHHEAPGAAPMRGPVFFLQGEDEPFAHTELVLIVSPDTPGELRTRAAHGLVQSTAAADGRPERVLIAARDDVPRHRVERNAPPFAALAPTVAWGEDASADAERRGHAATLRFRTRPSPWVAAATAEVVGDATGDAERAARIHAFVQRHVGSERGDPDPTAILLRRQGPRFFLEVAMLRAAGVPLRPAAVARQAAALDDAAPALFLGADAFPVLAVRVEPDDGAAAWLFSDLPRYTPLGFVPANRDGARALRLDDAAVRHLAAATPDAAPGWRIEADGRLDAEGTLHLDATVELADAPGYALAQQVRDFDQNSRQLAARNLGGRLFDGYALRGAELPAPDPGRRFALRCGLEQRGVTSDGEHGLQLALPLPPSEMVQRYGDRGERRLPYVLTTRSRERWLLEIELDPTLRLSELPPPLRIQRAGLDYRLEWHWRGDDGRLVVEREVALRPCRIPPEQFAGWLHALARVDAAEARRPTLRRTTER